MIERKLTLKQQAFADNYIEIGNATEAYLKAYPSVKKDTTARTNGSRLLTNANVKVYIKDRMEELKSERVADQQEILELLTSIARGETTAATLRSVDVGVQTIDEDMPPTMGERIKAAELLGKRHAMWTEKQEVEHSGAIKTSIDLTGLTTEELRAIANSKRRTD